MLRLAGVELIAVSTPEPSASTNPTPGFPLPPAPEVACHYPAAVRRGVLAASWHRVDTRQVAACTPRLRRSAGHHLGVPVRSQV